MPDSLAALNAMDLKVPDVILMALEGPDAAVYQAVLRFTVANLARHAHIPLVAIVGQGGESWRRALDSRLDSVLHTPLRPGELYATLARWLDLSPLAGQAPDEPLPPRWRRACIDGDVQEYERALARQDIANMVHFAHRAKGAALVLHADQAAELADRLELAARGYAPLQLDETQRTLAALKVAIARHFD
ncbi:Hpt domain-containing protein [Dyella choica]|uniref:Hpt domain-containing protein n=1 Tax=Dyella choica TaxID=1927959 RepID=UPI0013158F69|nr:Hpt domain-containing protein [Dyella choica]